MLDPEFELEHDRLRSLTRGNDLLVAFARRGESRAAAARTIARTLGKTHADWHHPMVWTWARAWLTIRAPRHVIVASANNLDARSWPPLLELTDNLDVWLLIQGRQPTRAQRRVLDEHAYEELEPDAFVPRFPIDGSTGGEEADRSAPAEIPPFPEVPMREFPDFELACRNRLEAPERETVLATFQVARRRTQIWLAHRPQVVPVRAFALLRKLIPDKAGPDEALTILRAAQIEFLLRGYFLKAPTDRFRSARIRHSVTDYEQAAGQFAPYLNTAYAAAAALVLDAHLAPDALATLRLRDIAADGASVRRGETHIRVGKAATTSLRANLLARQRHGASLDDHYLVGLDKKNRQSPLNSKVIRGWLGRLAAETGITLGDAADTQETLESWADRHGLTFRALHTVESSADAA